MKSTLLYSLFDYKKSLYINTYIINIYLREKYLNKFFIRRDSLSETFGSAFIHVQIQQEAQKRIKIAHAGAVLHMSWSVPTYDNRQHPAFAATCSYCYHSYFGRGTIMVSIKITL